MGKTLTCQTSSLCVGRDGPLRDEGQRSSALSLAVACTLLYLWEDCCC